MLDHIGQGLAGWQYTPGWGSLATVVTALGALTMSLVTLRRNTRQFERVRLDSHNDKLRNAIIDLLTATGELIANLKRASGRFMEIRKEFDNQHEAHECEHFRTQMLAVNEEYLNPLFQRITLQALAIQMLTKDTDVLESVSDLDLGVRGMADLVLKPSQFSDDAMRERSNGVGVLLNNSRILLGSYCTEKLTY